MREARYMRLISWTLQNGSEHYCYGFKNFDGDDKSWIYCMYCTASTQVYFTLFGKLKGSMHFLVKKYFLRIFYKRIFFLHWAAFAANWFYFAKNEEIVHPRGQIFLVKGAENRRFYSDFQNENKPFFTKSSSKKFKRKTMIF